VNYQVCAPGGTPCDTATLTVTATPSDMKPVFAGIPAISAPGSTVSGTISCTNVISGAPTAAATQAICNAKAVDSNGVPVAVTVSSCVPTAPVASLAVGSAITCNVSYTTPGTAGGSDTVPTSVTLTGVTGALNDNNAGNNETLVTGPIIDAVNDSDGKPGGTMGAQTNLFPNDDYPSGSTFTLETGSTCANPSVATNGVATYDVSAAGSCEVNYKVCAPLPNQTVCDVASLTVTATAADMTAVVTAPQVSSPGAPVNGSITCTNLVSSGAPATNATCSATAVDSNGNVVPVVVSGCAPASPSTLAVGANITCNVSYVTPGTAGGSNTTPVSVQLTAVTGATNDSNPGNNTDPNVIPIVDAVDDAPSYSGGTQGATTPLNANDQSPPGSLFTKEPGGTCANASVALNGLATYDVPASGSCTVNYKVCAPTPNSTVCDTATMTVTATPADMTPMFSGLPAISAPGSAVTGTITCTNVISPTGGGSATAATCNAIAVDSAGVNVPVTVTGCAPPAPSDVAVGGSISCTVSYSTPGTLGGNNTAPTSVTLTGTTGSTNDVIIGNNTTPALIPIIDALDDNAAVPVGTIGATTDLTPNDQFPLGSVFSLESGGTCVAPSISAAGIATYNVPATTACSVNYKVCAPAPNATQCDTATLNVTATLADVVAAVSVPSAASPGATVNGTITCTNLSGTAVDASCTASAQDQSGANIALTVSGCVPTPPVMRTVGQTIQCNVSYTMPGARGGVDTAPTSVTVTAVASAINDSVAGNNTAPGVTVMVDALNDTSNAAFGVATSINVMTNDTKGTATATPSNVTATIVTSATTGSTFDSATGLFSVPATASPGTYIVVYEICANPAVVPVACDTATASITVAAPGAPVAVNDSASTVVNTPITVSTPISSNDSGVAVKVRNVTGLGGAMCPVPMNTSLGGDQSKAGASCVVGGVPGVTCTVATTHGSVTVCQDGTYTYTPANGYTGTDSFNYQIVDAAGQFATATVNLTVSGQPDLTTKVRLQSATPTPSATTTVFVDFANIGPGGANAVVMTLQMPAGLSGVVPSNGGVYNAATGLVTWPAIANIPGNTPIAGTYAVAFSMPSSAASLDFTSNALVPGGEATTGNNPSTAAIASAMAIPTLSNLAMLFLSLIVLTVASIQSRRR
jgi:Bacterial Ig domain